MTEQCKTCHMLRQAGDSEFYYLTSLLENSRYTDYYVANEFKKHGLEVSHDSVHYHRATCLKLMNQNEAEPTIKLEDLVYVGRRNRLAWSEDTRNDEKLKDIFSK